MVEDRARATHHHSPSACIRCDCVPGVRHSMHATHEQHAPRQFAPREGPEIWQDVHSLLSGAKTQNKAIR